ncbi:helix-turn-helix transcriptional regulator [Alcaligenaceae bacterium]|nr:helix-turn-helix transcriptional regulator [Alcaligenaceae bacterium]
MSDPYLKLPAALTAAREDAGLTQKELGDRIGKTQQAVAKWENGESRPTRRSMGQLIRVLPKLAELDLPALTSVTTLSERNIRPVDTDTFYEERPRRIPSRLVTSRVGRPIQTPSTEVMGQIYDALPHDLQRNFKQTRAADYESRKAVIEIFVSFHRAVGNLALEASLWRLATASRKYNDERWYYLLMVPTQDNQELKDLRFQQMVARNTGDAALQGIILLVADNAEHAAQIITDIENGESNSTTEKDIYDDEEPHE